MTVFSSIASKWPLERIACRLFYFMQAVLDISQYNTEDSQNIKDIIEFSCNYLIFGAISKNKKFFSKKFIREIEKYSPFSFLYLCKLDRKLKKQFSPIDINNITTALQE
jgi:hypothetical protein